jgi:large subunit ribosomal protein L32e
MTAKFLRRTWNKYSKLGLRRKKKQVWRRPHGRDNKMREKRKGYGPVVSIGYRNEKATRGKINDKNAVLVKNLNELLKLKAGEIAILAKIGKKKRIEIAKKAKENKILIYNLNADKFLEEENKENKK